MESVIRRGIGREASTGKTSGSTPAGSRESSTFSGGNAGLCSCGLQVQQKVSRTANNPGRRFVGCSRYRENGGCGYFRWIDNRFEGSEQKSIVEEEVSSCEWEMKYMKLKIKELEKELKHRQSHGDVRVVISAICISIVIGILFGTWFGCKIYIGKDGL
ncbi:hypothetical protein CRG98_028062 [Punica granatum]|uniref:GRF-type domain-containing protein n=1 Tax=Punica granatum TaxID=22663 RepID=A0A2I0J5J5_PUNGR|nr:hypothetical protein CRG98_028062 [Punica granatum]